MTSPLTSRETKGTYTGYVSMNGKQRWKRQGRELGSFRSEKYGMKVVWDIPERRIVTFLRFLDESLLLESVGEVAVRVRKVGLELDRAPVSVDGEVNQPVGFGG